MKAASSPQYHMRNIYYGYYWWVEDYPYKSRNVLGYSARGAGGQLVFVMPELDLVVETMGGNFSNRRGARYLGNFIATSILPAVRRARRRSARARYIPRLELALWRLQGWKQGQAPLN